MHKKALLALLLAVTMILSGCALIEKDPVVDRSTEVIRVYDQVFTKGEIQDQIDYQIAYMSYVYSMYGMAFDPADPEMLASTQNDVINFLIEDAVMNKKVAELGLMDQLTEEEQAELDAAVEESWQSNLTSVQETYFADTELTGEELEAALAAKCADLGITYENVVEGHKITLGQDKLRAYITDAVTVTDEELQTAFDEHVLSDQATFATNPEYFGSRLNNNTAEVFYRPAGYRMVKQILVSFTEDDQALIEQLSDSIAAQDDAITANETALTDLGVTDIDSLLSLVTVTLEQPSMAFSFGEDAADPADAVATEAVVSNITANFDDGVSEETAAIVKALAEAKAVKAFYEIQLEKATENAFANIDAEADEILAALEGGADWDALMAEKTDDPGMQEGAETAATGYAVCEGFASFDEPFVAAAMALENVGDVSPKTRGMYGYYIIQYTAELEEGPVALDDVRQALTDDLLLDKQQSVYTSTLQQWVAEANAKIDYDALND